jgi:hypothetical protein
MISPDAILRDYSGRVAVAATGPGACEIRMEQTATGQDHVIAAVAGAAVMRRVLGKQTERMLEDLQVAAELQPNTATAAAY